jgi:hypothetical protein
VVHFSKRYRTGDFDSFRRNNIKPHFSEAKLLHIMKRSFKRGGPLEVVFYNKLPWFVSELPEKDISTLMVQCM